MALTLTPKFKSYKYECNALQSDASTKLVTTIRARLDPTLLSIGGVTNDQPDGDVNSETIVHFIPKRRSGIRGRFLTMGVPLVADSETAAVSRVKVPILSDLIFLTLITEGADKSIEYDGNAYTLLGISSEQYYFLPKPPSA